MPEHFAAPSEQIGHSLEAAKLKIEESLAKGSLDQFVRLRKQLYDATGQKYVPTQDALNAAFGACPKRGDSSAARLYFQNVFRATRDDLTPDGLQAIYSHINYSLGRGNLIPALVETTGVEFDFDHPSAVAGQQHLLKRTINESLKSLDVKGAIAAAEELEVGRSNLPPALFAEQNMATARAAVAKVFEQIFESARVIPQDVERALGLAQTFGMNLPAEYAERLLEDSNYINLVAGNLNVFSGLDAIDAETLLDHGKSDAFADFRVTIDASNPQFLDKLRNHEVMDRARWGLESFSERSLPAGVYSKILSAASGPTAIAMNPERFQAGVVSAAEVIHCLIRTGAASDEESAHRDFPKL